MLYMHTHPELQNISDKGLQISYISILLLFTNFSSFISTFLFKPLSHWTVGIGDKLQTEFMKEFSKYQDVMLVMFAGVLNFLP